MKKTLAEKMENQIDAHIKEARSKKLIALTDGTRDEYLKSFVGKTIEVCYEGIGV